MYNIWTRGLGLQKRDTVHAVLPRKIALNWLWHLSRATYWHRLHLALASAPQAWDSSMVYIHVTMAHKMRPRWFLPSTILIIKACGTVWILSFPCVWDSHFSDPTKPSGVHTSLICQRKKKMVSTVHRGLFKSKEHKLASTLKSSVTATRRVPNTWLTSSSVHAKAK